MLSLARLHGAPVRVVSTSIFLVVLVSEILWTLSGDTWTQAYTGNAEGLNDKASKYMC